MCWIKLNKPERYPPSLSAVKTQQNTVAVHPPPLLNRDENAEHLPVTWKMPLTEAEPGWPLVPSSGLLSKCRAPARLPLPATLPSMASSSWLWNCGKGADILSEQLAILQCCIAEADFAVFTVDPATEPPQEFPVWNPFILATAKSLRNLSYACQVWRD